MTGREKRINLYHELEQKDFHESHVIGDLFIAIAMGQDVEDVETKVGRVSAKRCHCFVPENHRTHMVVMIAESADDFGILKKPGPLKDSSFGLVVENDQYTCVTRFSRRLRPMLIHPHLVESIR
jgi:hypothetical protein